MSDKAKQEPEQYRMRASEFEETMRHALGAPVPPSKKLKRAKKAKRGKKKAAKG